MSESLGSLDNATYVKPATFSVDPRSIQHFLRVKPCDLWMVIDHASFNGNCTLSKLSPRVLEELVTGYIGTQLGVFTKTWSQIVIMHNYGNG